MPDPTTPTTYGPDNPHPLSRLKTELVWEGKYDEYGNRRPVRLPASPLPLQRIETIDEPRDREKAQQLSLFDEAAFSQKAHQDDFRNLLVWGDNKLALAALLEQYRGKVDLIYIDPPFDVGADFTMQVKIGDEREGVQKEQSILEAVAYRDTWGKGMDSYLHMVYERLSIMKELLSYDGSLYVHVGPNVSHYLKLILDDVLSPMNFRSEIVWRRSNSHNKLTGQYGPIHDVLLYYTRSDDYAFHPGKRAFTKGYVETRFKYRDSNGIYQPNYLTGPGLRQGDSGKPWHGFDPSGVGRHWAIPSVMTNMLGTDVTGLTTQEILDAALAADLLVIPKKAGGQPMYKQYLTEGVPFQDLWSYQPNSQGMLYGTDECIDQDVKWLEQEDEKLGYDTQKPEGLLARILETSSDTGDLVADFFCGSGTTLAVAEKMGRRWIGVDLGRYAIHTSRKRLIQVQRELHADGKPYRSFDVYNLGRYERQWWQVERLKGADREHRSIVLRFYKASPLETPPSPLLHGKKAGAAVHVAQIDSIFTYAELRAVAEAAQAAGSRELHCLAWEFEMELALKKQAVEAETGQTIRLKYIPREIMEPNRSEAQFFEAGFLEAKALEIEGKIDVELVRFVPALAEAPEKEMAALRERAVRSPFDFIDFWAVDFLHRNGKPFEHHWQDFRTRKDRSLKTQSDLGWQYETPGRQQICVKVIDVFGVDTTTVVEVEV